jgi:hypothetical protein
MRSASPVVCLVLAILAGCGRTAPEVPDAPEGPVADADPAAPDGGCTPVTWYADCDGDGVGGLGGATASACVEPAPSACGGGWTPTMPIAGAADCNDTRADIYPGAMEACDGVDNDCDVMVDEDGATTFYLDADADGYGNPNVSMTTCNPPGGYVSNGNDCNDARGDVHPGATEACDAVDNDCDVQIDEGALLTFYRDADGDGFGTPSQTTMACTAPAGYVSDSSDCNDNSATTNPAAAELCFNAADDNCSGAQDEAVECSIGCNWSGARWASHGWDGNEAFFNGAWFTCTNSKLAHIDQVYNNPPGNGSVISIPQGTGDNVVGCNWGNANRWMAQGWDAFALVNGVDLTCSGGRVTALNWENNTLQTGQSPVATQGQLGCDWVGAIYFSHGRNGNPCAWLTGFHVTCQNNHITNFQFVEDPGCPRQRD